jgi:hypothetical protein
VTHVDVFLLDWNEHRPFGGDRLGAEALAAFEAGRYEYTFSMDLREPPSDTAAAEAAYCAQGNGQDGRKVRVDRQTMSIADAVLVDGRAYVADHFGFARVPALDQLLPTRIASSWDALDARR